MKLLLFAAIPIVVASCAGNPAVIQQAEQQCRAQGFSPGGDRFERCVYRATEAVYQSWGRDSLSKGD